MNDNLQSQLDGTTPARVEKQVSNLFMQKTFKMHSGEMTDFKIECDALTDADIETIAFLISKKFKFGYVCGIPKGGLRLSATLKKYRSPSSELLIVDDVLTTGGSMEKFRSEMQSVSMNIYGAVIFARGKCPSWVTPIFQMTEIK